jgi:hypothetical protein
VESPPPSDTGRPAIPIRHNQPNTPPSTHYIRPEQVARKIEANAGSMAGLCQVVSARIQANLNCIVGVGLLHDISKNPS